MSLSSETTSPDADSSDVARLGVALDELFPSATRTGDGHVSAVSCASAKRCTNTRTWTSIELFSIG